MEEDWENSLWEAYDVRSDDEFDEDDAVSVEDFQGRKEVREEAPRKRLRSGVQTSAAQQVQRERETGLQKRTLDDKSRRLLGLDSVEPVDLESSESAVLTRAISVASSSGERRADHQLMQVPDSSSSEDNSSPAPALGPNRKRKRSKAKAMHDGEALEEEGAPLRMSQHIESILKSLVSKGRWLRTVDPSGQALYKPLGADRYCSMEQALEVLKTQCEKDARVRELVTSITTKLEDQRLHSKNEFDEKAASKTGRAPSRKQMRPDKYSANGSGKIAAAKASTSYRGRERANSSSNTKDVANKMSGNRAKPLFSFHTADGKSFDAPVLTLSEPTDAEPGAIDPLSESGGDGDSDDRSTRASSRRGARERVPKKRRKPSGVNMGRGVRLMQKEVNRKCFAYLSTRRDELKPFIDEEVDLKLQLAAKEMQQNGGTVNAARENGTVQNYSQPQEVQRELRSYQVSGMNFLIDMFHRRCSCILGDEMGLGKTLQAIAFLAHLKYTRKQRGSHLVMAPTTIVNFWAEEIQASCPGLKVRTMLGSMEDVDRAMVAFSKECDTDVLVTTYEAFKDPRNRGFWKNRSFITAILDEGHSKLKRSSSPYTKSLSALRHRFEWVVILSGTAVQENVQTVFSLLNVLHPEVFPNEKLFNLHDTDDAKLLLSRLLSLFMLRRKKYDVERSIQPLVETVIRCGLSTEQLLWYRRLIIGQPKLLNELEKHFNEEQSTSIGQKLQEEKEEDNSKASAAQRELVWSLLRVCNHPFLIDGVEADHDKTTLEKLVFASGKLRVLDRILVRLWNKKKGHRHRVVIFSHSLPALDLLDDYCRMRGWKTLRVDGGMKTAMRSVQIDLFNNRPASESFICLLSVKTGGYGLSFQSADTVILFDAGFNPYEEQQAISRVHRIGQLHKVHVYRLITTGTIEEQVRFRSHEKLALSRELNGVYDRDVKNGNEDQRAVLWDSIGGEKPNDPTASVECREQVGMKLMERIPSPTISDEELGCLLDRSRTEDDPLIGRLELANWDGSLVEEKQTSVRTRVSKLLPSLLFGHDYQPPEKLLQYAKLSSFERDSADIDGRWSYQIEEMGRNGNRTGSGELDETQDSLDSEGEREATLDISYGSGLSSAKRREISNGVQQRRFRNEDFCLGCWEGGKLICCRECPICYCYDCANVNESGLSHLSWSCDHHHCHACKKHEKDCAVIFRCEVCPETYCRDCLPANIRHSLRGLSCARLEAKGYTPGNNVCYMFCSSECEQFAQTGEYAQYALPENWVEVLAARDSEVKDLDFSSLSQAVPAVEFDPALEFQNVTKRMMEEGAKTFRNLLLRAFSLDHFQADCMLGWLQWPEIGKDVAAHESPKSSALKVYATLFHPKQLVGFFFLIEHGVELSLANDEFTALIDSGLLQVKAFRKHQGRTIKIFQAKGALLKDLQKASDREHRRLDEAVTNVQRDLWPKIEKVLLEFPEYTVQVCESQDTSRANPSNCVGLCPMRTTRTGSGGCQKRWHLCRRISSDERKHFREVLHRLASEGKVRLDETSKGWLRIELCMEGERHEKQRRRLRARLEAVQSFVEEYLKVVGWASFGELLNVANLHIAGTWHLVHDALESNDGDFGIGRHYGFRTTRLFERLALDQYDGVASKELPPTLVPYSDFSPSVIIRTWGKEMYGLQSVQEPLSGLAENGHRLVRVIDAECALQELLIHKKVLMELDKDCKYYALKDYEVPFAKYRPTVPINEPGVYWHRGGQEYVAVFEPLIDNVSDANNENLARINLGTFKTEYEAHECWMQNVLSEDDVANKTEKPRKRKSTSASRQAGSRTATSQKSDSVLEARKTRPKPSTSRPERKQFFRPEDFATESEALPHDDAGTKQTVEDAAPHTRRGSPPQQMKQQTSMNGKMKQFFSREDAAAESEALPHDDAGAKQVVEDAAPQTRWGSPQQMKQQASMNGKMNRTSSHEDDVPDARSKLTAIMLLESGSDSSDDDDGKDG